MSNPNGSINSDKIQVVVNKKLKAKLANIARKKGLSTSSLIRLISSEYSDNYNEDGEKSE